MNRREFLSLAVGMVAGSMIKPIEPLVKVPNRPRVAPTPVGMPSQVANWGKGSMQAYLNGLKCPFTVTLNDKSLNALDLCLSRDNIFIMQNNEGEAVVMPMDSELIVEGKWHHIGITHTFEG